MRKIWPLVYSIVSSIEGKMNAEDDKKFISILAGGNYFLGAVGLVLPNFLTRSKKVSQWIEIDLGFFILPISIGLGVGALIGLMFLLNGFLLNKNRAKVVSLIIAGFQCLYVPLGTILGICTFIVLNKESVRELYNS